MYTARKAPRGQVPAGEHMRGDPKKMMSNRARLFVFS